MHPLIHATDPDLIAGLLDQHAAALAALSFQEPAMTLRDTILAVSATLLATVIEPVTDAITPALAEAFAGTSVFALEPVATALADWLASLL